MTKILIHPELIELAHILRVADIDYEDMKGSNDSHEFADRARKAQQNLRCRKAELEGEGVEIWGDDLTPNAELTERRAEADQNNPGA